ncbi:MAG: S-layer protein [Clostridiales bacterium]|jgi:hypothetical protein|nr:S-layer protein [Clostridiales bacterium]
MNIKKLGIFSLLLFLLVLASSGTVLAGDVFDDVKEGYWAEKSIAEMKAKGIVGGVGDNKYAPKDPVTREQLIVMLVRTIGKANEAGGEVPVTYTYRNEISSYARGSMALAVREGIIAGSDLRDKPREPALRYEVAVLALRAMGLSQEAERLTGSDLTYTDTNEIPQWALGYVALASEKGIMGGNGDGTFAPMKEVSREEVAVILSRVDDRLNLKRNNVLKGEVYGMSAASNAVLIKDATGNVITCPVADNAYIYRSGKLDSYLNLASGDKLEIVKNNAGKAEYIEVVSDEEFTYDTFKVEGEIEDIIFGNPSIITIQTEDGNQNVYTIEGVIPVTVNGQSSSLNSLASGQKITAWVDGEQVTEISAENLQRIINGTIVEVDADSESLIVEDTEGSEITVQTDEDTVIELEGDEVEISELIAGQEVMIIAEADLAERIDANDYEWTLEGTFVEVDFAEETITVVNLETEEEETYKLSGSVDVDKDGDNVSLRDLVPGDELEIEMRNMEVKDIKASTVEKKVEGRVVEIVVSATGSKITVETEEDGEVQYKVAKDAKIERDRKSISISEINPGDWVEMKIQGIYAVELDVEARTVSKFIIGEVINIYEDEMVLIVENRDTNLKETIFVESDADIIESGRFRDLDDIDEEDEVIVVCDPEKEFLTATTIVIVGSR